MPSRTEMFFPESNIWSEETIRANTHNYSLDQTETSVEMFQTVFDKQEWMDISADLGLSFMGRFNINNHFLMHFQMAKLMYLDLRII